MTKKQYVSLVKWQKLALPERETHVAMFSTYRCMETIRLANELLEERKEMQKGQKASRKEKQNRMILKATEHDMYRLLDYKEKCLIKAGICLGVSGLLGLFLHFFPLVFWRASAYSCIFMSWGFYLVKEALEANGRIMQTKGCYMKLEEDCLVIRQPQRNEHYEVCRNFLQGNGKNRRRKP